MRSQCHKTTLYKRHEIIRLPSAPPGPGPDGKPSLAESGKLPSLPGRAVIPPPGPRCPELDDDEEECHHDDERQDGVRL